MVDNDTGEQSDLGPYCLQYNEYKLHKTSTVSYIRTSTAKGRERSGSMVECLTRVRGAAGSSLTGVTVLWALKKTQLS